MRFAGRRAVVTGAASGIGAAVARRLLAEGAAVVVADVDAKRLRALEEAGAESVVADVTARRDRNRVVAAAGTPHYLVNSAGFIRMTRLDEVTENLWDRTLDVNAKATFFLLQALAPRLATGGAVVNLSSTAAKAASTVEGAVYNAAKAAVIAITKTFAHALAAKHVRVNCVCPGIIDTPMQDAVVADLARARGVSREDVDTARRATVPLGRGGTADEVAAVICFLLSDDASYMTGQAINVSGGLVTY